LDHLKECAFFLHKDLDSVEQQLKTCRLVTERGANDHDPHLLTLLDARIAVCENILHELQHFLSRLNPELTPTYEKLVSILRSLSACNTRSKYPSAEVQEFKKQLEEIRKDLHEDAEQQDGQSLLDKYTEKIKGMSIEANTEASADKLVSDLLTRCLLWVDIIEEKQGKIAEPFKDTYDKLAAIRNKLEQLQLTQAWSLRETDLWSYQRQLDRIDEGRVDGNFLCPSGKPADLHVQRVSFSMIDFYVVHLITRMPDAPIPATEKLRIDIPSPCVLGASL